MNQNMGHTEVAKTPGEGRENGDAAVAAGFRCLDIGAGKEIKISGDRLRVGNNGIPATCGIDTEDQDNNQRKGHYQALNEARNGRCHEPAHGAVGNNDNGRDDHCGDVIPSEHRVEQFSAGNEAGRCIGDKENDDHESADGFYELGIVTETAGQKVRYCYGINSCGIGTQPTGNDKPVEISTGGKTDCSPTGFRNTAEQRKAGNTHQQIRAHI